MSEPGSDRRDVPEPPRFMSDKPALVTHCTDCEESVGLRRHIREVDGRFYAVCYDCSGDEDEEEETEQQTLVTDGGYEKVTITDDWVRANVAPSQEARSWCLVQTDEGDDYWVPTRLDPADVDDRDAVPDPDLLPGDEILQHPLESRGPELAGGAMPPADTKDRVVK